MNWTTNNLPVNTTLPMLLALNRLGKHVYPGTVPEAVTERRRAANKRARKARRTARLAGVR